ncbi:MAG: amidohydrolase family protein, partial [Gammaproteobacteria bacterium]|nr:amidohydrolase family protein [Gammaproteobacteria bacterium]
PEIIQLLMDRTYRQEVLKRVHPRVLERSVLKDLDRQYTMNEIAIITRAGPARLLGLKNKGHLGVGADADITIYDEMDDKEQMFNAPRYVIKDGNIIIEDHEIRMDYGGRILHATPEYDGAIEQVIRPFFEDYYSIRFDNYAVADSYLHRHEVIAPETKN